MGAERFYEVYKASNQYASATDDERNKVQYLVKTMARISSILMAESASLTVSLNHLLGDIDKILDRVMKSISTDETK